MRLEDKTQKNERDFPARAHSPVREFPVARVSV